MKEFKGTKGNWKFNGNSLNGHHYNVVGTALGGKFKIARVPYELAIGGHDTPYNIGIKMEAEANAKLIAAAPELLSTLQDMQQLLEYLINAMPTGKVRDTACDANIIALYVINKALS